MSASFRVPRGESIGRFGIAACLMFLSVSCVTPTPEPPVQRDEVEELPASRFATLSADPRTYETTEELTQAIQRKVRRHLVLPHGRFPATTKVTVKVVISSEGQIQNIGVTESSGFPAVDQSVQQAVLKSAPLPVLASLREAKKPLDVKLIFLPFSIR